MISRFGLGNVELKDVDELLEEVTRKVHQIRPQSRSPGIPLVSLLGAHADFQLCTFCKLLRMLSQPLGQGLAPACPLHTAAVIAASDTADLPREQKLALLKQLRKALKQMHAQLQQAEAGPRSQVQLVVDVTEWLFGSLAL